LYVGEGRDVAKHFGIRQKIEFLLKATPKWQSPAEGGKVRRDKIYATAMGVDAEKFAAILKERKAFGVKGSPDEHYVDAKKWASLTNGRIDTDSEVRDGHTYFTAVYDGHPAAEPAAKK